MATERQAEEYWRDEFTLSPADETAIQEYFLQKGEPLTLKELVGAVAEIKASEKPKRAATDGQRRYDPAESYEVGERLSFPMLESQVGEVIERRAGENQRFGDFQVIRVRLDDQESPREFAAELAGLERYGVVEGDQPRYTAEELVSLFGPHIQRALEQLLKDNANFVQFAGRWLPTLLLVNFNEGHRNIAEAMIDITGSPMKSAELLTEIPLEEEASETIKRYSLDLALSDDPRFENVGSVEAPRWYLPRLG